MTLRLGYLNARAVAYAVKNELEKQGWDHLSPRPWNMYDPNNTFWWLVPGPDWPAYRYGKLFFSPDRAPDGHLFVGIHVEKGLHQSVGDAYPSTGGRRLIMRDDWSWYKFFNDLQSLEIGKAFTQISEKIKSSVMVRIEAGFVEDPGSFDPQATRPEWDVVNFYADGNSLEIHDVETPSDLLGGVADSKNLTELTKTIPVIRNINWVWIDCFIGNIFQKSPDLVNNNTWNANQLCDKFLSILKPWIT
jgi:hypothetical protein